MALEIIDGEALDRVEAGLAERASEPAPDVELDADADARAAMEAGAQATPAALAQKLSDTTDAREVAQSLRPGTRNLFEGTLEGMERVLIRYRQLALREVQLGRPVPPVAAVAEDAVGFAEVYVRARGQEEGS